MSPRPFRRRRAARPARPRLVIEALEDRTVPDGAATFGPFAPDPALEPSALLVRFRPGAAGRGLPGATAEALPLVDGLFKVALPPGASLGAALAAYRADPEVLYAEPDYPLRVALAPNDPAFGDLWGLHNAGQTGGTPDADIDAPEAWDLTTGSAATLVAVIDTGVDYNHPDLAANMWRNSREIAGNRRDDDGNGYVDDVYGYDVVNNDGDPMDDHNHGTHVAGTIGAVGNNGAGVTGVAWNVRIMAVKCFDASGNGSISNAVKAIDYAVANGATISNNSWGGNEPFSQALYDAVRRARDAGQIFVAGAGNGNWIGLGQDNDLDPFYPANLDLDNVVSVAATDHNDQLAIFSNYGATTVDLAAPGVNIRSTTRGNTYNTYSGTSMATPHVSGVMALVRGQHPEWTYRQVINKVLASVDPIPALRGKTVTGGRLNAAAAVTPDLAGPRVAASTPSAPVSAPVSSLRLTFSEPVDPATFTAADVVSFTGPAGAIAVSAVSPVPNSGGRKFDVTFAPQSAPGAYSMVIGPDVRDFSGNRMNQDGDGVNGEADDRYTAAFSVVPFAARFDYGTTTSPVAEGYRQVLPTSGYAASAGFGWLSSPVYAETRPAGTDLTADLNYGPDLTFAVDVPEATYQVTLTVGDAGPYPHDQVGVYLEGAQRDTVSTAAGEVKVLSYRVAVRDGQLTLRLKDLGGTDPNAVINGLEVVWLGPAAPRVVAASPTGTATGTVDRVGLTFDEAVRDGSFTLADVVSLAGPRGAIAPTAVNKVSDTRYEVTFAPQSAAGDYTLVVGPDVRDAAGNPMDQDQDGVAGEAVEDRFTAAFRLVPYVGRFDFGTPTSPVAAGYARVTEATAYTAAAGFGWLGGPVSSVERTAGTDLTRDLCYGADLTFLADVPNGAYDLTVTVGDAGPYPHDQVGVYLEGAQRDTVSTAAGEVKVLSYRVAVNDGQLTLRLKDLGGSDVNAVINALDIIWAGPDAVGPRVVAGPAGTLMGPVDRVTLTFDEALAEGTFTPADVTLIGPAGSIGVTAVTRLTDTRYEVSFAPQTAAGDYRLTVGPDVRDAAGNLMDQDQDGVTGESAQDQFTAAFKVVPYVGRFDFGTPTSPVAAGYARVTEGSAYTAAAGFGWQSGPVLSVERTSGTDLARDLCFGPDLTFAADVPNGTYDLTVTVGDAGPYPHDQVGVYLEGAQRDTVSTAAGEVKVLGYRVAVNDGQLTLRLKDLGGTDPNAVINGLDVVWAGPDTHGPRVTAVSPAGEVLGMVDRVVLTFDEVVRDGTFTLADVAGLTGPQGAITPTAVNRLGDTRYEVVFPAQSAAGDYTLVVGPDVRDAAGNPMDQDQDGVNGEPAQDQFTGFFRVVSAVRFDFGTGTSPVAAGYRQVTPASAYSPGAGFGWQSGPISAVERTAGTDLTRDLCYGTDLTFAADVPNGTYDLTVTVGDTGPYPHDQMALSVEGKQLATLGTAAGEVIAHTYRVTVNDGQLSLRLHDLGGSDVNAVINALDIVWAGPDAVGPRVVAGPPATLVGTVDRVVLTFDEGVQDGSFTLADVAGLTGPRGAIAPTAVNKVSDTRYEVVFPAQTAAGDYTLVVGPDIRDRLGNLMDQDQDGVNGEPTQDQFTAAFRLTSAVRFDFGTPTSPVAAGYARVTEGSAYTAAAGFGWQSGPVSSVERSTGTDLTRDLCYGPDLLFAADVASGTYDVTLTAGDPGPYLHDHVAVSLEGVQVATISTAAGEVIARTYRVAVNDGQLSLRLHDLGGSDLNAVLNGLEIVRVESGGVASVSSGGRGGTTAEVGRSSTPVGGAVSLPAGVWPAALEGRTASTVSPREVSGPGRRVPGPAFAGPARPGAAIAGAGARVGDLNDLLPWTGEEWSGFAPDLLGEWEAGPG